MSKRTNTATRTIEANARLTDVHNWIARAIAYGLSPEQCANVATTWFQFSTDRPWSRPSYECSFENAIAFAAKNAGVACSKVRP